MKRSYFLLLFLLGGCMFQSQPTGESLDIPFQLQKTADIPVSSAVCVVSASDMDTIRVNLNVSSTMIYGSVPQVPFGQDRLFELSCYDAQGVLTYFGSAVSDINTSAAEVNITLYAIENETDVTIVGRFGDVEENEEKIVFAADWNGNYDIYIMNTNGTGIRQLTFSEYSANCPRLSPDRKKVVFQRGNRTGNVGHMGYLVDVQTLEETMLPLQNYSPHCLHWHPDGDKLVFWSGYYGTFDIFEYDMTTDSVRVLVKDSSRNWGPTYSPDGETLIYYSNRSGRYRAYWADADGQNSVQVLPERYFTEERCPQFNPVNPDQIVFGGRGFTNADMVQFGLFIYDSATDSVHLVSSTVAVDESYPTWSPDGSRIAYGQFDGSSQGLMVIRPDGSDKKRLANRQGNERWPHWR